jgi:hypothetical protein
VGSRGDVQPYIALALQLVADGHRVRLATVRHSQTGLISNWMQELISFLPLLLKHGDFKDFVREGGKGKVEFFDMFVFPSSNLPSRSPTSD